MSLHKETCGPCLSTHFPFSRKSVLGLSGGSVSILALRKELMVPALLCSSKRDPSRPSCTPQQCAGCGTSAAICSTLLSQKLKRQSTKYRSDKIYPTAASEQPENVKKNRYKDILPCRLGMAHVPTQFFVFLAFLVLHPVVPTCMVGVCEHLSAVCWL